MAAVIEAGVLAVAMLCSGITAAVFTAALLRRRPPTADLVEAPPGTVITSAETGRRWTVVRRTIRQPSGGGPWTLSVELIERAAP